MKNLLVYDKDEDELEAEIVPNGLALTMRFTDADDDWQVGMVVLSEAQGRVLYMWLAEALGAVKKGYNQRHDG